MKPRRGLEMITMKHVIAVGKGMLFGLFGFAALPILLVKSIIEILS